MATGWIKEHTKIYFKGANKQKHFKLDNGNESWVISDQHFVVLHFQPPLHSVATIRWLLLKFVKSLNHHNKLNVYSQVASWQRWFWVILGFDSRFSYGFFCISSFRCHYHNCINIIIAPLLCLEAGCAGIIATVPVSVVFICDNTDAKPHKMSRQFKSVRLKKPFKQQEIFIVSHFAIPKYGGALLQNYK